MGKGLVEQYMQRRKVKSLCGDIESFCFLKQKSNNEYHLIACSHYPKTFSHCSSCPKRDSLALELIVPDLVNNYRVLSHTHIHPDEDLVTKSGEMFLMDVELEPVSIKHKHEIELVAFQFWENYSKLITGQSGLNNFDSKKFFQKWDKLPILELAIKNPVAYDKYFRFFTSTISNRKYLYYGDN